MLTARGLKSATLAVGALALLAGCQTMGEEDRAMIQRASQDAAAARSAAESAAQSAQAAQQAAAAAQAAAERAERIFQESLRK